MRALGILRSDLFPTLRAEASQHGNVPHPGLDSSAHQPAPLHTALSASRQGLDAPAQSASFKRTLLGGLDLLGDPYLKPSDMCYRYPLSRMFFSDYWSTNMESIISRREARGQHPWCRGQIPAQHFDGVDRGLRRYLGWCSTTFT